MRDSGIMASPSRSAAHGPGPGIARASRPGGRPAAGPPAVVTVPAVIRCARHSARASSVRPEPTRPASPTISPARTSRDTPCTPGALRPRASSTTGASGGTGRRGGNVVPRDRPSIELSMVSSVSSAAGAVRTRRPSRRIVTWSASSATSRRKCETRTTVVPPAASLRMTWCSRSTSGRPRAAVGSSITISRASRHSARRISTFCWSAVRSVRPGRSPLSSKPAVAASSS